MGAHRPGLVAVLVALLAVGVVHQDPRRDEVAGRRTRQRGEEIAFSGRRPFLIPTPGILGLDYDHDGGEADRHESPPQTDLPLDSSPGQAVQDEQPRRCERAQHVGPIGNGADSWVLDDDDPFDAGQNQAAGDQTQGHSEQAEADIDRPPIRAVQAVSDMDQSEDQEWQDEAQSQRQMDQEHHQIEPVLVGLSRSALEDRDPDQVGCVHGQQREEREDDREQLPESGTDSRNIPSKGRCGARGTLGIHGGSCSLRFRTVVGRKKVYRASLAIQRPQALGVPKH